MDTQKAVDDLANDLEAVFPWIPTNAKTMVADFIFSKGYIPKESAVEFVEICSACEGSGIKFKAFQLHNICPNCDGNKIVMRMEK